MLHTKAMEFLEREGYVVVKDVADEVAQEHAIACLWDWFRDISDGAMLQGTCLNTCLNTCLYTCLYTCLGTGAMLQGTCPNTCVCICLGTGAMLQGTRLHTCLDTCLDTCLNTCPNTCLYTCPNACLKHVWAHVCAQARCCKVTRRLGSSSRHHAYTHVCIDL